MMLSSEALERQFGTTKLEILLQNDKERVICTKAADSGQVLELSKVVFQPEGIAMFPEVHRRILDGASMGGAFKKAGVRFRRAVRASYRYDDIPASFTKRFGARGLPTVTDVLALVGPDNIPYADILEVYSPAIAPWEPGKGGADPEIIAKLKDFGALLAHTP